MSLDLEEPKYLNTEREIIPNAFVVNALIFNEKGEILLLKRKENHKYYPGYWGLIMEKVKENEPFVEALNRGIKEELDVIISKDRVRQLEEDLYKEWNGKRYQIRRYFVEVGNASIFLNSEHDEYNWVDRSILEVEGMDIMPDSIDMIRVFYND